MARRARTIQDEKLSPGHFVAAFMMMLIGTASGLAVLAKSHEMHEAVTWPTAEATIVRSDVVEQQSPIAIGNMKSEEYFAEVEYRFTVEGREYHSRGTHPLNWGSFENPDDAAAKLDKYPVGAVVTVHYRREDPFEAYLEVGRRSRDLLVGTVVTGVALFFGVAYGWELWKRITFPKSPRREDHSASRPAARSRRRREDDFYD